MSEDGVGADWEESEDGGAFWEDCLRSRKRGACCSVRQAAGEGTGKYEDTLLR